MEKEIKAVARQHETVQSIMRYINEKTLTRSYFKQPESVTKEQYGKDLEANIKELLQRMKNFSYFPQKKIYKGNGLKHEFRFFEDDIVESVFKEILVSIYEVKNPVVMRPRGKGIINVGERPILLPYVWQTEFQMLDKTIEQKKLIDFLKQYVADKNFMRYLQRFLESGVLERQMPSDGGLSSDGVLSSVLWNVYYYHVLRDWLSFKSHYFTGKVYLRMQDSYFCFFADKKRDLLKICNGLVDAQGKTRLQIINNTYIRCFSLKYYA